MIYSQLSDYSHSGVRLFRRFSKQDSFRSKRADCAPVAWSALDWLSQIIGLTADALESDFGEIVVESQQRAKQMWEREQGDD